MKVLPLLVTSPDDFVLNVASWPGAGDDLHLGGMSELVQLGFDYSWMTPEEQADIHNDERLISSYANIIEETLLEICRILEKNKKRLKRAPGNSGGFTNWVRCCSPFSERYTFKLLDNYETLELETALRTVSAGPTAHALLVAATSEVRDPSIHAIESGEIEPNLKSVKQELEVQIALADEEIAHHLVFFSVFSGFSCVSRRDIMPSGHGHLHFPLLNTSQLSTPGQAIPSLTPTDARMESNTVLLSNFSPTSHPGARGMK